MSNVNPNPPMSLADLQKVERTKAKWEDLESQYNEVLGLFDEFLIYPQVAREHEKEYTPQERGVVKRLMDGILADLKATKTALDELRTQHQVDGKPRQGWVMDNMETGELFTWLGIATSYRGLSENIQAIMAQPLADLTIIFNDVRARQAQNALAPAPDLTGVANHPNFGSTSIN